MNLIVFDFKSFEVIGTFSLLIVSVNSCFKVFVAPSGLVSESEVIVIVPSEPVIVTSLSLKRS